jgi:hypothetical protein
MPCQDTATATPSTIETCLIDLGFQLMTETGTLQVYRYQQFTLKYYKQTNKVECYYGTTTNFDYYFVGIILNCADLKTHLRRNGVIS